MSGWDTDTGESMAGFPRVMDDWQFFNTPTLADIDNDTNQEVIIGSGGYFVHAFNYLGEEPAGWPKQTGGWIIASAAVGDFDGDEKFEVAISTRAGWLFMWHTEGQAGATVWSHYCGRHYAETLDRMTGGDSLDRADTRNFAVRAGTFHRVGGFRTQWTHAADWEFGARLHHQECRTVSAPAMRVRHPVLNTAPWIPFLTTVPARRPWSSFYMPIAGRPKTRW